MQPIPAKFANTGGIADRIHADRAREAKIYPTSRIFIQLKQHP